MAGLVKKDVEYDSDEELFPTKVEATEEEVEAEPEEDTTLGKSCPILLASQPCLVFHLCTGEYVVAWSVR